MPIEASNVGILDDQGNRIGGVAAPVRVDPVGTTTQPVFTADISTTATLAALNATLALTLTGGQTTWVVDLRGTFSAASGITFQGSADGTNFKGTAMRRIDDSTGGLLLSVAGGATYILRGGCAGLTKVQLLVSAFQAGDSITATIRACAGAEGVFLESALPAGGQTIGAVVGSGSPGSAVGGVLSTQHPDVSASAALTSGASTVTIALVGAHTVATQIAAGTLAATLAPQYSVDGGTTYKTAWFRDPQTRLITQSLVLTNPNAATTLEILVPSGSSHARVAVSAFTSGAANCAVRGAQARPSDVLGLLYDAVGNGPVGVAPPSTAPAAIQPALVCVFSPNQPAIPVRSAATNATTGVIFGAVQYGGTKGIITPIEATTYTEQTTNFTGSIKSSNATDTAAGVGARTMQVTTYDQAGAGPTLETATLNGTTAVNLVATAHCFVERMDVLTAGSSTANVGTLSLFTGAAGAGTLVGTIAVGTYQLVLGDNQTLWAHHYVAAGKTLSIYDLSGGTNGNQTGQIFIRAQKVLTANSIDAVVSDNVICAQTSNSVTRVAANAVGVTGFARVRVYVISNGTNTQFFGSFDYSEQ